MDYNDELAGQHAHESESRDPSFSNPGDGDTNAHGEQTTIEDDHLHQINQDSDSKTVWI